MTTPETTAPEVEVDEDARVFPELLVATSALMRIADLIRAQGHLESTRRAGDAVTLARARWTLGAIREVLARTEGG